MVDYGITLSSEEHGPQALIEFAIRSEALGADFCAISDHFHPWLEQQGHSPFVWSVLGGIAARTTTLEVATGVTCPIIRMHPVIVAQAAATTALLFDGRFRLGVGTGEALNEHVLGYRWPRPGVRLKMLEEAVGVIRELCTGETVDFHGDFYEVENARLFDVPAEPFEIIVSAFGPNAAELAASIGDGYWGHSPDPEVVGRFSSSGGEGPMYAQINVCLGEDEDECRDTVHRYWANGAVPGQLPQELPSFTHFEQATSVLDPSQTSENVTLGNDPDAVLAAIDPFFDAGYDHIYLHQIGPDQEPLFRMWEHHLADRLRR